MREREVIEDMQAMQRSTKERFLQNLEKALRLMICDRLNPNADDATRKALASEVADFIRYNAGEYTLEELAETFTSYDTAVGLFYEYQDAKRLVDQAPVSREAPSPAAGVRMAADRWLETLTGMAFVWVPGGSFLMGSGDWDDQGLADEKPVHEVWLDGFWMGQTPVTAAQFSRFTKADPGRESLHDPAATGDVPVAGVSWHDAAAFARWLSQRTGQLFRLPSEAQWEYAARSGGRAEKYAGSDRAADVAWYADNSGGRLHRVARKKPNGLNIYDMCGNVCEWCLDHYAKSAYQHHGGHNPVIRLDDDTARVVRGGSWRYGAKDVRCADRGLLVEDRRETDVGFRLIRSA